MKALAFAMEKEAAPLLAASTIKAHYKYGFAHLYEAQFMDVSYIVLVTGIGKVFAGAGVATLIDHYAPESITNVGICASLEPKKAPCFSTILGKGFVQHDYDTYPLGKRSEISGLDLVEIPADKKLLGDLKKACKRENVDCYIAKIASGDQFIDNPSKVMYIKETFGVSSVDMESAAMAQIAYVYKVPFSALRVVSDAGNSNEYEANAPKAIEIATQLSKQFLLLD